MRTEYEIANDAANQVLMGRVQSAADYHRYYMTFDECLLWPSLARFVADVQTQIRFMVS